MPKVNYTLHLGDALETMQTLEAGSVDCVFVDLPYFGIVSEDWDNQWASRDDYLDWVVALAHEWKRITKDNSSIFIFCDEKMEAYIQVRLDEIFLLLNKIVWFKKNSLAKSATKTFRSFAPVTERALFYEKQNSDSIVKGEHTDNFVFESIRSYLDNERKKAGVAHRTIIKELGMTGHDTHFFSPIQWRLPLPEQYQKMREIFKANNHGGEYLTKDYESLRQEFESLRRPFNSDNKTFDVIEWANVNVNDNTEHPTTKPLGLYRRILSVIANPGNVVLDCCMGSGTAGVAALELGMPFIGIENHPPYFEIAKNRITQAALQPGLFTASNKRQHKDLDNRPDGKQRELFNTDSGKGSFEKNTPGR